MASRATRCRRCLSRPRMPPEIPPARANRRRSRCSGARAAGPQRLRARRRERAGRRRDLRAIDGIPWRSSWRRPGPRCCRSSRSAPACRTASGCSAAAAPERLTRHRDLTRRHAVELRPSRPRRAGAAARPLGVRGGMDARGGVRGVRRRSRRVRVLDHLSGLVNKSLVIAEHGDEGVARYGFLETVRQYAEGLHVERGERAGARRVHAEWLLSWAERAAPISPGPTRPLWLDRMERENGNLRAALDALMEDEPHLDLAVRMAAALQWLWVIRGYMREGRDRLEAIAARADSLTPSTTLAAVLARRWQHVLPPRSTSRPRRRIISARSRCASASATHAASPGRSARSATSCSSRVSTPRRSISSSARSSSTASRENQVWEAANLTCLGSCSRATGDLAASRAWLDQAVAMNRAIGHKNGECYSLDGLGCLLLQTGDSAGARTAFEQALAIERELGNDHEEAVTLSNPGPAGGEGEAISRWHARTSAPRSGSCIASAPIEVTGCLHRLAGVLLLESQPERAVRLGPSSTSFVIPSGPASMPTTIRRRRASQEHAKSSAPRGSTRPDRGGAACPRRSDRPRHRAGVIDRAYAGGPSRLADRDLAQPRRARSQIDPAARPRRRSGLRSRPEAAVRRASAISPARCDPATRARGDGVTERQPGRSHVLRAWEVPWRRQASARTWSRIPLTMYSACHAIGRAPDSSAREWRRASPARSGSPPRAAGRAGFPPRFRTRDESSGYVARNPRMARTRDRPAGWSATGTPGRPIEPDADIEVVERPVALGHPSQSSR